MKVNPDSAKVAEVQAKLKESGGYCPCEFFRSPETKCMCKKCREDGVCSCGLFVRADE